MVQESRLSIVIDSRTAEQQAKDLKVILDRLKESGVDASVSVSETPPLAWGRLHGAVKVKDLFGNTPTRVGKTLVLTCK